MTLRLPDELHVRLERVVAARPGVRSLHGEIVNRLWESVEDQSVGELAVAGNGATMGVAGGAGAPSPAPAAGHEVRPDPKPGAKR
jgi:hypothetical protein